MLPGKRTATGALYVLQGPPPAGSPLVGGIALSPLGAIYISQALFVTNLDNDSFEDFPILHALGLDVTEDEDSYNIDFNGDGIADVIVPKP